MAGKRGKNRKKGGAGKIILIIVLILAILLIAGFLYIRSLVGKSRYLRDDQVQVYEKAVETESELDLSAVLTGYDLSAVTPVSEEQRKDTYTLLVIGGERTESSDGSVAGDAEAIILMTINHRVDDVMLIAVHKDTYAMIPDVGGYTLSDAYKVGGGPLLIRTMEENYGIRIDNYASVSLRDVARAINMPEVETLDISNDGLDVVEQMVFQSDLRNPANASKYISGILPYVTHNLTPGELLNLVTQIPKVVRYFAVKKMMPFTGLVTEVNGMKVPQIRETAELMHDYMYASTIGDLDEAARKEASYAGITG